MSSMREGIEASQSIAKREYDAAREAASRRSKALGALAHLEAQRERHHKWHARVAAQLESGETQARSRRDLGVISSRAPRRKCVIG